MLQNITFYKSVEDMFSVNNVLEYCWENDILSKNLLDQIYVYNDKYDWLKKLKDTIEDVKFTGVVENVYLCRNNEYQCYQE